jgi:hypothetical protein
MKDVEDEDEEDVAAELSRDAGRYQVYLCSCCLLNTFQTKVTPNQKTKRQGTTKTLPLHPQGATTILNLQLGTKAIDRMLCEEATLACSTTAEITKSSITLQLATYPLQKARNSNRRRCVKYQERLVRD